jgi:hypothetical protein
MARFNPDLIASKKRAGEVVGRNPHGKATLSGGSMAAQPGGGGRKSGLGPGSHDAWDRATAPFQSMEARLVKGQTGLRLNPKKKKKGRWSGFVFDLTLNRKKQSSKVQRMQRPSDAALYGEDPRRARVRARINHLRSLRP